MAPVFKICAGADWENAVKQGFYEGSAVDQRDGFIHLSSLNQVRDTARRHFAGVDGLVLVALESEAFGEAIKWEPSRAGDLFPHVYGRLNVTCAKWVHRLPLGPEGHIFPEGLLA